MADQLNFGADKFKAADKGRYFLINDEEREMMLQILNDIRVDSWRLLGGPEDLDVDTSKLPETKLRYFHFMQLAGYFEHHILALAGPASAVP